MRLLPVAGTLLLLAASLVRGQAAAPADGPVLRVHIAETAGELTVSCAKSCSIAPRGGGMMGRLLLKLEPTTVALAKDGFRLGNVTWPGRALDIMPEGGAPIVLAGSPQTGGLRFIRSGQNLVALGLMPMEQYLLGVLPSEMPPSWPAEALKAQAVAARTYALYYARQRAGEAWDLGSTVEDQVYKSGAPPPSIREAVAATRGEVLRHKDEPFPAFFHSTCGGGTEKPGVALDKPEFDFLGATECDYCRDSTHYRWRVVLTADEIARALAATGVKAAGPVRHIESLPAAGVGRKVLIEWDGGKAEASIVEFRRAIGRMRLKSGKFEGAVAADGFVLDGRGLGHGAGMCQYGARGMAREGRTYREILRHYYGQTDIGRDY